MKLVPGMQRLSLYIWLIAGMSCRCLNSPPDEDRAIKLLVERFVEQIDENPDHLHGDYSPAVHKLIGIGRPALKHGVLDLLLSNDQIRRLHGLRVLSDIIAIEYGFKPGRGWANQEAREQCEALWERNGALRWDSSEQDRLAAHKKWSRWLLEEERKSAATPKVEQSR